MTTAKTDKKNVDDDVSYEGVTPIVPFFCSCRFALALIAFFGFLMNYAQRVGMSIAIVCMVNQTAIGLMREESDALLNLTSTNVTQAPLMEDSNCGAVSNVMVSNGTNVTAEDGGFGEGSFVWPKSIQGHILGAFFYGYLVSQIPAGIVSERFGPKWVFGISLGLGTVCTLLSPWAANISYIFLIILRVLLGISSGALFPAMHCMWGRWAPPMERSKLAGISYAGAMMGNVVAMPLSGILCKYGFNGGWPSVFYVIGIVSVVSVVLWMTLTSNTPNIHPRITKIERAFIVDSLDGQVNEEDEGPKPSLPWLAVIKSRPMWAICVANFCSDWGLYTFLTNIPTFLSDVLKFDITSNGFYSALPFLGLWANMNISPVICDRLRSTNTLNTTICRKMFNTIGLGGAAVFLVALSYMECSQSTLAIVFLVFGVTLSGCGYTGFLVNHMDIAPQFAGTLFGISNGLASCSGFIAPPVAAAMTPDGTRKQWQAVFWLAAGIYAFGAIFYLIFGSGELQPWAHIPEKTEALALNGQAPEEQQMLGEGDKKNEKDEKTNVV